MRKYLNKGLLYEWFNASKVPIMIGLIIWGLCAFKTLKENIEDVKNIISEAQLRSFTSSDLESYFILAFIFLAIYIFANGANKRNTMMFLCSGPYTKKQIKVNELICLLMTLGLFIIMFLYIAVIIYVRNHELISIVNGYPQVILIEVIRLVLFGTIGILLLIQIDMLFSNSIVGYFGMIALAFSTICICVKLGNIISYLHIFGNSVDRIPGDTAQEYYYHNNILFYRSFYYSGGLGRIIEGIIFLLAVIAIMILIFNVLEKRSKLETASKIFSSKFGENMITYYLSLGIGAFVELIIINDFLYDNTLYRAARMQTYVSAESFEMLAIDLIIIGVTTFISYKIIKKILKAIG